VTWAEDVLPIFHRRCVECHRDGGEAPFSLLELEPARANAEMIAEVVRQRRMPPWFASEAHDEFVNRRDLSPDERRTVLGWVAAGTPPGDVAAAPPPPPLPTGAWTIGEPDLVLTQLGTTDLPADGYVPYQYVVLPYVFLEETWVEAVQILPENRSVLHHANLAYFKVGEKFRSSNFITGQVPGGDAMILPAGVAVRIPAGSVLGLQAHYVTTGREESDRLRVGLRFPREPVRQRLRHVQVTDLRFEIPPHAPAHEVRARRTLKRAVSAVGLFSHMHLRGRDMTFLAHRPDGEVETLLVVPNYSFDWQMSYQYGPEGKRFPAGTTIEVIAHFDNSSFNPFNPDPDAAVRFGLQTFHEMMYGFFFYLEDGEDLGLRVDPENGHALD
ncbi:MAG: alkyl hydroperoxide reductase, partial [Planctomycetota bacterium JB042]